jgi:hypothetical protein
MSSLVSAEFMKKPVRSGFDVRLAAWQSTSGTRALCTSIFFILSVSLSALFHLPRPSVSLPSLCLYFSPLAHLSLSLTLSVNLFLPPHLAVSP